MTSSSQDHGIFLVRICLTVKRHLFLFISISADLISGYGIINADGDLWKAQRKAGLHFLNTPNLKILTDVALPHHLSTTIEDLQTKESDQIVDLEHIFLELTTQLMGQMAYGVGSLF